MTGGGPCTSNRRRILKALGMSVIGIGLAGCSGDEPEGSPAENDETASPVGTESQTMSGTASQTPRETTKPTDAPPATTSGSGTNSTGSATLDLSLRVRESQSNVDQFETLQTEFQSVALRPSSGEAVNLADSPMAIDLTELEAGEDVPLFEASIPEGTYEELALIMPIQEARLTDASEPEFSRTVPATADFRSPFEIDEGDTIEFSVIVALIRIAGGDTWTYTIGYSYS